MNYTLLKDLVGLAEKFEAQTVQQTKYDHTIGGFRQWVSDGCGEENEETTWEGQESGRSLESVIATSIVHLNRYGKTYSRSAMIGSDFSTQDDFIYLINLKVFGAMSKMDLIRKNVHDKPVGMHIIHRLIQLGWVIQKDSETDRRSKIIEITPGGLHALDRQMGKIRKATRIVSGNLSHAEKKELVRLMAKLDHFHRPIFLENINSSELLDRVSEHYLMQKRA